MPGADIPQQDASGDLPEGWGRGMAVQKPFAPIGGTGHGDGDAPSEDGETGVVSRLVRPDETSDVDDGDTAVPTETPQRTDDQPSGDQSGAEADGGQGGSDESGEQAGESGSGQGGGQGGAPPDPNAPLPPLTGSDGGNLTFDEAGYKKLISEMDGIELSLIDEATTTSDMTIGEQWSVLPTGQTWEPAADVNAWSMGFGAKIVTFNENLRMALSTFTVGLTAAMDVFDETDDLALYSFSSFVTTYPDLNIGGGQVMGSGGPPPGLGGDPGGGDSGVGSEDTE
jgi:hypothetical protein